MENEQEETRWINLSYLLNERTPAYGNGDSFSVCPDKSMDLGDSCNTSIWKLPNHLGTHIDFPKHFSKKGNTFEDYESDYFISKKIGFIDLEELLPGKIITATDLSLDKLSCDIEFLFIKTGFCYKRGEPVFWQENPGFDPCLADSLRSFFPNLRVMGFDSISLSSFTSRDIGRKAHKAFLDSKKPILPIEDMNFSHVNRCLNFKQVIIAPWMVEGADGVPCNVLAEVCFEK